MPPALDSANSCSPPSLTPSDNAPPIVHNLELVDDVYDDEGYAEEADHTMMQTVPALTSTYQEGNSVPLVDIMTSWHYTTLGMRHHFKKKRGVM